MLGAGQRRWCMQQALFYAAVWAVLFAHFACAAEGAPQPSSRKHAGDSLYVEGHPSTVHRRALQVKEGDATGAGRLNAALMNAWKEVREARSGGSRRVLNPQEESQLGSEDGGAEDSSRVGVPESDITMRDPCGEFLNIKRVAILFLTRGPMHHEKLWEEWFGYAGTFIPYESLLTDECDEERRQKILELCSPEAQAGNTLQRQHLYSVYVNPRPDFEGYAKTSIFNDRIVPNPVKAEWGTHSLVLAAKKLLRVALQDPRNFKFLQLSESCIPIYPPHLIWQQLSFERKSRINACWIHDAMLERRWTWRMDYLGVRGEEHWRKSSQWFGLNREHAELAVEDTDVEYIFEKYCWGLGWDPDLNKERECYGDEHYIPTLLAWANRGHETDCFGWLVNVDWSQGGVHPRSYLPSQIDHRRIRRLRRPAWRLHYEPVIRAANGMFARPAKLVEDALCNRTQPEYERHLEDHHPLFARKFPPDTAEALLNVARTCENQLWMLNDNTCIDRNKQQ